MATRILPPGTRVDLGLVDPFEKVKKAIQFAQAMGQGISNIRTNRKANIMGSIETVGNIARRANDPDDLFAARNVFNAIPETHDPETMALTDYTKSFLDEEDVKFTDLQNMGNQLLNNINFNWSKELTGAKGESTVSEIIEWMNREMESGADDVFGDLVKKLDDIEQFGSMKNRIMGDRRHNFKFQDEQGGTIKAHDFDDKLNIIKNRLQMAIFEGPVNLGDALLPEEARAFSRGDYAGWINTRDTKIIPNAKEAWRRNTQIHAGSHKALEKILSAENYEITKEMGKYSKQHETDELTDYYKQLGEDFNIVLNDEKTMELFKKQNPHLGFGGDRESDIIILKNYMTTGAIPQDDILKILRDRIRIAKDANIPIEQVLRGVGESLFLGEVYSEEAWEGMVLSDEEKARIQEEKAQQTVVEEKEGIFYPTISGEAPKDVKPKIFAPTTDKFSENTWINLVDESKPSPAAGHRDIDRLLSGVNQGSNLEIYKDLDASNESKAILSLISAHEHGGFNSIEEDAINKNKDGSKDLGVHQINERWINLPRHKFSNAVSTIDGRPDTVYHQVQGYLKANVKDWDNLLTSKRHTMLLENPQLNAGVANIILQERGITQWATGTDVTNSLNKIKNEYRDVLEEKQETAEVEAQQTAVEAAEFPEVTPTEAVEVPSFGEALFTAPWTPEESGIVQLGLSGLGLLGAIPERIESATNAAYPFDAYGEQGEAMWNTLLEETNYTSGLGLKAWEVDKVLNLTQKTSANIRDVASLAAPKAWAKSREHPGGRETWRLQDLETKFYEGLKELVSGDKTYPVETLTNFIDYYTGGKGAQFELTEAPAAIFDNFWNELGDKTKKQLPVSYKEKYRKQFAHILNTNKILSKEEAETKIMTIDNLIYELRGEISDKEIAKMDNTIELDKSIQRALEIDTEVSDEVAEWAFSSGLLGYSSKKDYSELTSNEMLKLALVGGKKIDKLKKSSEISPEQVKSNLKLTIKYLNRLKSDFKDMGDVHTQYQTNTGFSSTRPFSSDRATRRMKSFYKNLTGSGKKGIRFGYDRDIDYKK